MVADVGRVGVRVGAKVAQCDQRLAAGVLEDHALPCGVVRDEDLVTLGGQLADLDLEVRRS